MGKINRKCIICGTSYEYCGHCDKKLVANETWRNIYCSEKCRDTFTVLEQYTAKKINADAATSQLESLGVDVNKINPNFKTTLDSIEAHKTKVEEEKPLVLPKSKKTRKKKNHIVKVD